MDMHTGVSGYEARASSILGDSMASCLSSSSRSASAASKHVISARRAKKAAAPRENPDNELFCGRHKRSSREDSDAGAHRNRLWRARGFTASERAFGIRITAADIMPDLKAVSTSMCTAVRAGIARGYRIHVALREALLSQGGDAKEGRHTRACGSRSRRWARRSRSPAWPCLGAERDAHHSSSKAR